jgi:spore coat polysaccharide biosynthesis protein SpsF (cytidylyltransferase family)
MSKTIIGIQARSGSTRFPGKSLQCLKGIPIWKWVYNACYSIAPTDMLIPDTDELMIMSCKEHGAFFITGPENSPLERYKKIASASIYKDFYICRITADCPLINKYMLADMINICERPGGPSFLYNEMDGMDIQMCHSSLFEIEPYTDNEHVFNMEAIKKAGLYHKYEMHLSIDTIDNLRHIHKLLGE